MRTAPVRSEVAVDDVEVSAYTVSTDAPEADGTLSWTATTIVVVHACADGEQGLGYSYTDVSAAKLVESKLADVVRGADALAPQAAWDAMVGAVRNAGRPGIGSMAIAAVDLALWDLKARLLGLPLCRLMGMAREAVPVYGSGGFTSYSVERLQTQLSGWVEQGIPRVKMKVGSQPEADPERVRRAREAIGPTAELFVDANGAYTRKQALELAERFHGEAGVSWFEEPVSSEDLEGLRVVRDRAPAGCRSRPASTATTPSTSGGCWPRVPSMCSRPTSRAAPASPNCCAWMRCAGLTTFRCRCTAARRSTCTPRWRSTG